MGATYRAPGDFPSGKQNDVLTVEFTVMGIPCLGLNGGPAFPHREAFSFQVATDDQAETDRLWNAIIDNGGQASACGWCKDKWGLNWQITPRALMAAISDPDRAAPKRAFDAMDAQLEEQAARFMADRSRNRYAGGKLEVSRIFDWYGKDFALGHKGIASLPDFMARHAERLADNPADRDRIRAKSAPLSFLDYDWKLNDVR